MLLLTFPKNAFAYIDPASISFLFQTITVIVSTLILYIRRPSEIINDLKRLNKWIKKKIKKN